MKKQLFALIPTLFFLICQLEAQQPSSSLPSQSLNQETEEEGIVFFNPPSGWLLAESNVLPAHVRVLAVGKGPSNFPPSINLSWEPYTGTLKQYLKTVKNINTAQGYEWKDLGTIQTQAGTGSLSQVDTKTQWGDVRLMHVILIKNHNVYILTASALKSEFSIFYKDFFATMRSLKIAKDVYEVIMNPQQRNQLKAAADKLQTQWQTLLLQKQKENSQIHETELQENVFNSEEFQNTFWNPFKDMLQQKYNQLGAEWQALFLQKLENQLLSRKS